MFEASAVSSDFLFGAACFDGGAGGIGSMRLMGGGGGFGTVGSFLMSRFSFASGGAGNLEAASGGAGKLGIFKVRETLTKC